MSSESNFLLGCPCRMPLRPCQFFLAAMSLQTPQVPDELSVKPLRCDPDWQHFAPNFICRTLENVVQAGNSKQAASGTWQSHRYLVRKDGFGFSFHHTVLCAGQSTHICYKNHVEAVLVFSGHGEIELCHEGGKEGEGFAVFKLEPGVFYGLGGQENHYLRASKEGDMHVACAFNPPIDGAEDHKDGVYPVIGQDGVPHYSFSEQQVPEVFKPPTSLASGSSATAANTKASLPCTMETKFGRLTLRNPVTGDGAAMWQVGRDAGLDPNSVYCYNLQCANFADTCLLAVDEEGRAVGYVMGHRPPQKTRHPFCVATRGACQPPQGWDCQCNA